MPLSPKSQEKLLVLQRKAADLYDEGYSLRVIAKKLKHSHTWVWEAVRKIKDLPTS
jgi:biotin operon repressor